jgi:predicted acyl esterase
VTGSFEHPQAIKPNEPLLYKFDLPTVNHVFEPGHRIMVQVQSTLYPLYDRNPQTFVANIFNTRPADYQKSYAAHLAYPCHRKLTQPAGRSLICSSSCGMNPVRVTAEDL